MKKTKRVFKIVWIVLISLVILSTIALLIAPLF